MRRTIEEIWDNLATHEKCRYCLYGDSGCDGGTYDGPDGKMMIYPLCVDGGVSVCFDYKTYFADHPEDEST